VWTHRNEAINKRVRISSTILYRRPADVLDNPDVALVIRMDAFIAATAEAAVECAQTMACSRAQIKIGAHFNSTADSTILLGEKQGATKWIPGRTIDAVESRDGIRITGRHQCDAMIRMGYIEIDTGYVSAVSIPVWHLMSLEQKMP